MLSEELESLLGAYWDCAYQEGHLQRPDGTKAGAILSGIRSEVRAIAYAVRAEMLAGVAVPEPNWIEIDSAGRKGVLNYYTADQMRTAIAAARADQREEDAKVCERMYMDGAALLAGLIRKGGNK